MKRTQIYLDERQDSLLQKRAKAARVSKSELIREAIDAYLNGGGDARTEWRRRWLATLDELAKNPIRSLPDGKRYVEALRRNDRRRARELERQWRGR